MYGAARLHGIREGNAMNRTLETHCQRILIAWLAVAILGGLLLGLACVPTGRRFAAFGLLDALPGTVAHGQGFNPLLSLPSDLSGRSS
jgi:hypothetical protein